MSRWMRFAGKRKRRILYPLWILGILILSILMAQRAMARTYTITDGERVVTYTTFATDPTQVLGEAGLQLGGADSFTMGGRDITIARRERMELRLYGEPLSLEASGETVEELLLGLGIHPEPGDRISCDLRDSTFGGMVLSIDRMEQQELTYTAALAHGTEYCYDASLPAGAEQVLIGGVDGELLRTARIHYRNGKETHRELVSETMLRAPVPELIAIGTAGPREAAALEIGDGYIRLPTGEVLTYYKSDTVRATAYTHTDAGCDTITYTGTRVRKGTVAVDPRFIPYGTRMFIVSNDGEYIYGIAVAEDCGGAIKRDRIDLYFPTYQECMEFGRRSCTIYFLG